MATVFLSYARDDAPKAKALAKWLERAGYSVWWDRHIHGGSDYSDEIETALRRADAVLVIWSETSVHSQWVRDEAAVGRDSGRLVPLLLADCGPPLGFRQLQTIPIAGWSGRGRPPNSDAILAAIAAHVSGADAAEQPTPSAAPTKRRMPLVALAALLAILAAGAWFLFAENRPAAMFGEEQVSLAVLPFTDLSPQRDKSFFAEGVAEEILSTLATEPGIKVLGRTSARHIERNPDPKAVRASLGITHILEGSMRTAGNQIRVNVRLVDTKDGAQIWQEEYQGQLGDVFAVQDQIAGTVVQRLRGTFGRLGSRFESARTGGTVYQDYLAARALARTRTRASLSKAMAMAKKVVAAAPDYAAGHALLAELYFLLSDDSESYGTIPVATARRLAMPHAREAIRLAPDAADGYAALGLISPAEDALRPLSRAIELDPSRAELRVWLGISLTDLGRHDEALEQYREATAIEPLWAMPVNVLVQALAASDRYDEALNYVRQFERRGGSKAQVFRFLAHIARFRGDLSEAIAYSKSALALDPNLPYLPRHIANDYYLAGFKDESLAVLPREFEFTRAVRSGRLGRAIYEPSEVWGATDGDMVIHGLASRRDWQNLLKLYAAAPADRRFLCTAVEWQGPVFVWALRAAGRHREAGELLRCIERRLDFESRMHARATNPQHPQVNEPEFRKASLLALKGNASGAVAWLKRAIDRHWIGRPYSTRLADYPQFDSLRNDPRLAELQRRIDARIARERADLLSQRGDR